LIGSANVTSHVLDYNLECGIPIRGGAQPAQTRDHIIGFVAAVVLITGP
jgi:hypothetical protein